MKTVIVLYICAAVVLAVPIPDDESRTAPAIKHEETRDNNGEYTLHYVTADGVTVTQHGRLVPTPDGSDYVLIYDGEYSFTGDDGKTYTTKYTTDITGAHQPQGDHLPKAPEPEAPVEPELPKAPEPIAPKLLSGEIPPPPVLPKA